MVTGPCRVRGPLLRVAVLFFGCPSRAHSEDEIVAGHPRPEACAGQCFTTGFLEKKKKNNPEDKPSPRL